MAQPNFGSILDKSPSDVKPPPILPVGSYLCVVQGMPRSDKSTKKGTEFLEYNLAIIEPFDDVDEESLKNIQGGVKGKIIRATYYLTDNALWRLKEFYEHCGLDVKGAENMRELVEQPNGCHVIAYIRHDAADDNSGRVFSRLAATAPFKG